MNFVSRIEMGVLLSLCPHVSAFGNKERIHRGYLLSVMSIDVLAFELHRQYHNQLTSFLIPFVTDVTYCIPGVARHTSTY